MANLTGIDMDMATAILFEDGTQIVCHYAEYRLIHSSDVWAYRMAEMSLSEASAWLDKALAILNNGKA